MQELITIVAMMQGTFFLGMTSVFLFQWFRKVRKFKWMEIQWVLLVISFNLIGIASLITFARNLYSSWDIWYILVIVGYILADIAAINLFKKFAADVASKRL